MKLSILCSIRCIFTRSIFKFIYSLLICKIYDKPMLGTRMVLHQLASGLLRSAPVTVPDGICLSIIRICKWSFLLHNFLATRRTSGYNRFRFHPCITLYPTQNLGFVQMAVIRFCRIYLQNRYVRFFINLSSVLIINNIFYDTRLAKFRTQ